MGLDQYLHAKKFTHNGSWAKDEDKALFATLMEATKIGDFVGGDFPTASIEFKVAQWRKQNAIHNWFVQTCQGGEDDCRPAYVSREQLEALRDTCREVIADPTLAEDELPTSNGFFFGNTDYDEWYLEGLRYTVIIINKLLTMPDEWEFEYSSSW